MFRDQYPAAWFFHQNTIRWPFNTLDPEEEPWVEPNFKEYPGQPLIELPAPDDLNLPLGQTIRRRLSCRLFNSSPLTLNQLSTILAVGNGVEGVVQLGAHEHLERPMPSGGGLYPLEFYPLIRDVEGVAAGLYHYAPLLQRLEQLKLMQFGDTFISQLFMNQPYLAGAPVVLFITAVVERSMHKYGERGYRYILLEAGHSAENMCLAAASMNLGALPLGGFFDGFAAELLEIDPEQEIILYGLGFGHAATDDRVAARNLASLLAM